jgi:hypothetical protein
MFEEGSEGRGEDLGKDISVVVWVDKRKSGNAGRGPMQCATRLKTTTMMQPVCARDPEWD